MADGNPTVIILAGPNGAGKTTASRSLLAEALRVMTFVNADIIAQGLSGFDPTSAAVEASRLMLDRIHKLAEQRASFAFETTLAGRTLAGWLRELRQSGYRVELVYLWLDSENLAVARVAQRVMNGGHNIPEHTIRQRYHRSVRNFFQLYRPVVDAWRAYDNSRGSVPELIAYGDESNQEVVAVESAWQQMKGAIT